jgi:uncharacterized protein
MRVLACPKLKLTAADQQELLADYLPHCRSVRIPTRLRKLPQCRDANDQMLIELAAVGKADFLVTGNKDLLVLAAVCGDRIVSAEVFAMQIDALS